MRTPSRRGRSVGVGAGRIAVMGIRRFEKFLAKALVGQLANRTRMIVVGRTRDVEGGSTNLIGPPDVAARSVGTGVDTISALRNNSHGVQVRMPQAVSLCAGISNY